MEDNYYDGDYYERSHYSHGGHWSLQRVAFVFVDGHGHTLQRCNFVVNPSSMQYNYPDRNVFIQTLGRYPAMQGYGAGLHTIQISGQTGYHKTAIMREGATGPHTNYGEAKRLKHILVRDISQAHDDFEGDGLDTHANSELWFMNYTDGDCYQVELSPQAVQFSRTNNDPLTYYYTITMTVIRNLKDPLPSQMTLIRLGNDHTLFPTVVNNYTDNVNNNVLPFNKLYNHPNVKKPYDPYKAFLNGRGSILNPLPKKNIKTLENKSTTWGNPNVLSVPQKAKIMSAIDRQNNVPHTIDVGPFKVKIDPSDPNAEIIYWTKWLNKYNNKLDNIKPIKVKNGANKPKIVYRPPKQSKPVSVLPSFIGVTDGNAVHVLVPSSDFDKWHPQKGYVEHSKPYYNKYYFKNTNQNNDNEPLSNLYNGNLTVSEVVSNNLGDLTIEPVSPNTDIFSYQEELTTITDQNRAFVIQPNQFEPDDNTTPVKAPATDISSDYVQFYRSNNQLVVIFKGKTYTNADNYFVLSDIDNQMYINTSINPEADNWLSVSLNGGNIYIQPSGPEILNDNSYYMYGLTGSHTVFGNNFMIVPNSNQKNTVFDNMSRTEAYSANTDSSKEVHYKLDGSNNIHPVNVNGDTTSFNLSDTPVSNQPKMNTQIKYKLTKVDPDIIQGQSYQQNVNVPKRSDNK